jgi:flagellar hook-length control protein FliK
LGNVKIQLEMTENKITGHIIVETNEALRAFEREIHSLEQAFRDSGFAGADLDTALASGNEGSGADQQWRGGETEPFFSERFAASSYDAVSDRAEELVFSGRSDSGLPLVNMLV